MYENKKIAVIIAAAGKGTRVGGPVPKQYLKIGGEPVILKMKSIWIAARKSCEITVWIR